MAAVNYFLGWTEQELLDARKNIQKELAEGKRLTGAGAGEINSAHQTEGASETVLERIEYSLYVINPTRYPLNRRIRRTSPRYL